LAEADLPAEVALSVQRPASSTTGTYALTSTASAAVFQKADVIVTSTCVRVSAAGPLGGSDATGGGGVGSTGSGSGGIPEIDGAGSIVGVDGDALAGVVTAGVGDGAVVQPPTAKSSAAETNSAGRNGSRNGPRRCRVISPP
jgi:hypothetical protein